MFKLTALLALTLFINSAYSETKPARRAISTRAATKIVYGSPSWNTDSRKIDSAYLILRDHATGHFFQVQLEETEPDSSEFMGTFSLKSGEKEELVPEIYVPPTELRFKDADNKKIYEMISSGKLPRKPTIWKHNARGESVLDVYDTREQAEAALKAYNEQQRLATDLRKKNPLKPMTQEQARNASQADQRKAELQKLALEANQHEQDRIRLEQIEKQRAEDLAKQNAALDEQKRQENNAKAAILSHEAEELYDTQDFVGAEYKFKAASELDPANKDYYFKYGVTLYRNEKFNEAFVTLKLAKVSPELEVQREYYLGLCLYRLHELEASEKTFAQVAKSSDPVLAPSAEFYRGVILFAQEHYDDSKTSFEKVIDTSKEPALDRQAEDYIDRIASAAAYQKMREKRWSIVGTVGLMYDSNVLLSPGNIAGTGEATNQADARVLTVANLQYRAVYNEHHEFTPNVSANLTNSLKNSSAPADPDIYTLNAPYAYKGSLGGKAWKMTVTPGYEVLYMDPSATGTKTLNLSSYYVMLDNSFVMTPWLTSNYTLEYRNDKSSAASSVGPDDISANQYTVRTTQTFFLDSARKHALMPTLDYVYNPAKRSNWTYNRYDVGLTYITPVGWSTIMNAAINYYQMDYTQTANPARLDHDYQASLGFTKPIRDWVIWGLNGTYTANNSTSPTFEYSKYVVMTTATFLTSF